MRPGKKLKEEWYIRHGTQSLIASFFDATGQIIEPSCGNSRNRGFCQHIWSSYETDAKKWR